MKFYVNVKLISFSIEVFHIFKYKYLQHHYPSIGKKMQLFQKKKQSFLIITIDLIKVPTEKKHMQVYIYIVKPSLKRSFVFGYPFLHIVVYMV